MMNLVKAEEWYRTGERVAVSAREAIQAIEVPNSPEIIFDCDGVLVDSERTAVRIDAQEITEAGSPITESLDEEKILTLQSPSGNTPPDR